MKKNVTTIEAAAKAPRQIATSTLTIDGTDYKLGFSMNALCEAERASGVNLLMPLTNFENLNAHQVRGLLYAGIKAADPASKMTFAEVGELIRFDTIFAVNEALAESLLKSVPAKAETETVTETTAV